MKRIMALAATVLVAGVFFFASQPVLSAVVAVRFTVDTPAFVDEDGLLSEDPPGAVTGTYWYDTQAQDLEVSDDNVGAYSYPPYLGGMAVLSGNHRFVGIASDETEFYAEIGHDNPEAGFDRAWFVARAPFIWADHVCNEGMISLYMYDETGTAIPDSQGDDLFYDAPNLSDWTTTCWIICHDVDGLGYGFEIWGGVDSFELTAAALLEQLTAMIDRLEDDGYLSDSIVAALSRKLLRADVAFSNESGSSSIVKGCNYMDAFLNQIDAFTPRWIPHDSAKIIIGLTEAIMGVEGCDVYE